jgi:uncharacterized protein Smg (DUF494 family)
MFERILEILSRMISQMDRNDSSVNIDVEELKELGYTQSEISTAFSWLADRVDISTEKEYIDNSLGGSNSFRILHEGELGLFSPDAWGKLINLNAIGLLTNKDIEKIIERVIMAGKFSISEAHVASMVSEILMQSPEPYDKNIRTSLSGDDTIH